MALLDFCAILVRDGLNIALASSGGSSSVFSKEVGDIKVKTLRASFSGLFDPIGKKTKRSDNWDSQFEISAYNYSFSITYDANIGRVYISEESIDFVLSGVVGKYRLLRNTSIQDGEAIHEIRMEEDEICDEKVWEEFRKIYRKYYGIPEENLSVEAAMGQISWDDRSILVLLSRLSLQMEQIRFDIAELSSANINPNDASEDCAISNFSSIKRTGEGLASLLYALKNDKLRPLPRLSYYNGRKIFDEINDWAVEVNQDIGTIDVKLSHEDMLLKPLVTFRSNPKLSFPFNRLSDGTVKWIALSAIVLSDSAFHVIEEPENFLHPHMQQKFISLLRSAIEGKRKTTRIITTHSETLVSMCQPDEIIIFFSHEGKTFAKQPTNRVEIEELIRTTQFSLGYFYRIGAFDVQ